jgi:hypothetical protein
MAKPSVLISLETVVKTEDKTFGRSFMQHLLDEDPRLEPELVSTSEHYKDPFIDLEHYLENWWAIPAKSYYDGKFMGEHSWGSGWKRKSTLASQGMVTHGLIDTKNERTISTLWFESRWHKGVDFTGLFMKWVELAKPQIGMMHLFTEAEGALVQGEHGSSFACGSFGGPAKPGIPNIGWAMAYGEGYAFEVDVDTIRSAGFPVDVIEGVVIVRVTESLADVVNDFEHFSRRRAELKRFFRTDLFWIKDEVIAA